MIVSFNGSDLNVRRVKVQSARIRENDLIVMNSGVVKCVSVALGYTLESLTPFLQFLFETENGVRFPVSNLSGQFEVLRK